MPFAERLNRLKFLRLRLADSFLAELNRLWSLRRHIKDTGRTLI